jgi:hypothetical protein
VLLDARAKSAKEADESLDVWEAAHRARIEKILAETELGSPQVSLA